ncbi:MAG: Holliday junction branch migration protein RuvA [Chloroflexota bacterium]|jgi:Holliday junction DNA helicase RuvA|nr:Holliday junction branch migration protein RuvA [Chloroflexota bacterium]
MIASLTGEISQVLESQIVLNVGGFGLLVNLTEEACLQCRPGMRKAFHTYLVVREDNLSLYGFETVEERDLFVHLIGVAGVGPKTGLAALSTLTPEAVKRAITGDQPEIFTRVSGIGKKTAQKIILDLQGQVKPLEPLEAASKMDDVDAEVMEALTALGYSIVEAQAALQSLGKREEDTDAEERLRKALQYFS